MLLRIIGIPRRASTVGTPAARNVRPGRRTANRAAAFRATSTATPARLRGAAGGSKNDSSAGMRVKLSPNDSMMPNAPKAPNSRTAGMSLTTSEPRPIAVVSEVMKQGAAKNLRIRRSLPVRSGTRGPSATHSWNRWMAVVVESTSSRGGRSDVMTLTW